MDYFEKYKEAKIGLFKLISQFYDAYFTNEELDMYQINNDNYGYVFHYYNPEAMYIWNKLNLNKPIYTFNEIWNLETNVKNEERKGIDYYREYLQLKALNIYIIKRYYRKSIDIKEADEMNIKYDYDYDEYNGKIDCCNHYCESAGEHVWNMLDIDEEYVPISKLDNILDDTRKQILKLDLKK